MEYLFELILNLVLEGSIEISKSKKVPKFIRYVFIILISLFIISVIGLIFFVGFLSLKQTIIGGIFIICFGLFMLVMSIIKFRKVYLMKTK